MTILSTFAQQGVERLHQEDPALYQLLENEYDRQAETLTMVASCSIADPSVFACSGATRGLYAALCLSP